MAERSFEIRTEPHKAHIGTTTLLLVPEANGADFVGEYAKLRAAQVKVSGAKALSNKQARNGNPKFEEVSAEALTDLNRTMRDFVSKFLMDESKPVFAALVVPDRVMLQLIEFAAELYGGGSGNQDADGGTSTD